MNKLSGCVQRCTHCAHWVAGSDLKTFLFNRSRCYLSFHGFAVLTGNIHLRLLKPCLPTPPLPASSCRTNITHCVWGLSQKLFSFSETCGSRCVSPHLTIHSKTRRHPHGVQSAAHWKTILFPTLPAKVPSIQWPSSVGEAHLRVWKLVPGDYHIWPICHSLSSSNKTQMARQKQNHETRSFIWSEFFFFSFLSQLGPSMAFIALGEKAVCLANKKYTIKFSLNL